MEFANSQHFHVLVCVVSGLLHVWKIILCKCSSEQKPKGDAIKRATQDYIQNQKDANSQNMMKADVALSDQERKANAVAS
jgi:cytoskeletal protein RodZ